MLTGWNECFALQVKITATFMSYFFFKVVSSVEHEGLISVVGGTHVGKNSRGRTW